MKTEEIVVSPHFVQFHQKELFYQLGIVHSSGIFNTGLIAVQRGDESGRFLQWWANLLLKYCYKDRAKGMWNEQKWLDLATGLFNYGIQKDPGYNVGPWNFHERTLTLMNNGQYGVNGWPLCLFHFSGLFSGYFEKHLEQASLSQRSILEEIRREYLSQVREADREGWRKKPWSYDYFTNSQTIEKDSRSIFKNNSGLFKEVHNPFSKTNAFFKSAFDQHQRRQAANKKKG